MPETRLRWHLVQCPDKQRFGHNFDVCPYNSLHHISKEQFETHKAKCPDRTDSDSQLHQEMQDCLNQKPVTFNKDSAHSRAQAQAPNNPNDMYLPGPDLQYLLPPPGFEQGPSPPKQEEAKQSPQQAKEPEVWVTVKAKAKSKRGQDSAAEAVTNQPVRTEPKQYESLAQYQLSKDLGKRVKTLKKRVKEMNKLEAKRDRGEQLSDKETAKVASRATVEEELRGIPK